LHIRTIIAFLNKRDITVRLNTEAAPNMFNDDCDIVIAAVGSEPVCPPISGVNGDNVIFAPDAFMNSGQVGQNVVIIVGCEVGVEVGCFWRKEAGT
jgi:pyruvate/2-oxoglutarate dehydrogenase complex dihydrolipoamide dehydrogenase (E3) component